MKKHLKVILCFVIITIIIGAILFFRHNYVNLEGEFVKRDIEEVTVHLEDVDINELNRCSEIRDMIVSRSADDSFAHLKVFKHLERMLVFYSLDEYSSDFIDKINKQPNLKTLDFVFSKVDLNGINNSSVETMILSSTFVKNLQSVADCGTLKYLSLDSVKVDDCIIAEKNTSDDKESYNYYLRDSSVFSTLDNIEELRLYNIYIEDISGFADMDSLKSITISEGFISDETIKELEENGIDVIIDTIEENS